MKSCTHKITKNSITPRNMERRQFVQEWFGTRADINKVGTVDEKDQKKWRITKTQAKNQQQNGIQNATIKAHQIMLIIDENGVNEIEPLETENEKEQRKK